MPTSAPSATTTAGCAPPGRCARTRGRGRPDPCVPRVPLGLPTSAAHPVERLTKCRPAAAGTPRATRRRAAREREDRVLLGVGRTTCALSPARCAAAKSPRSCDVTLRSSISCRAVSRVTLTTRHLRLAVLVRRRGRSRARSWLSSLDRSNRRTGSAAAERARAGRRRRRARSARPRGRTSRRRARRNTRRCRTAAGTPPAAARRVPAARSDRRHRCAPPRCATTRHRRVRAARPRRPRRAARAGVEHVRGDAGGRFMREVPSVGGRRSGGAGRRRRAPPRPACARGAR